MGCFCCCFCCCCWRRCWCCAGISGSSESDPSESLSDPLRTSSNGCCCCCSNLWRFGLLCSATTACLGCAAPLRCCFVAAAGWTALAAVCWGSCLAALAVRGGLECSSEASKPLSDPTSLSSEQQTKQHQQQQCHKQGRNSHFVPQREGTAPETHLAGQKTSRIPELSDVSLLESPPASPCTSSQSKRLNMLPAVADGSVWKGSETLPTNDCKHDCGA